MYNITYHAYTLTNSMEQGPSWEANSYSASKEILWNPKIHYCVPKSPPISRPCVTFPKKPSLYSEELYSLAQLPSLRTTPYRLFRDWGKGEGKKLSPCLTKHHDIKAYWGNGGIVPRILDLGTGWMWVVSFTPRPL